MINTFKTSDLEMSSEYYTKAINHGNIEELKKLIDQNYLRIPPNDHYYMVEYLLQEVIRSDTQEKNEIFDYIVKYCDVDFGDRNYEKNSMTLLMNLDYICTSINDWRMILKCVKNNDINLWDNDDESILYMEVWHYYLVENNLKNNQDETIPTRINFIIELLKHDANPLSDNCSKSSIRFIIENNMFDLLKIFVEYSRHYISFEAIHYSILIGNYDFIEYLINHLVDINQLDKDGKTLLEYATVIGAEENIIELLRQSGIKNYKTF